MIASLSVGLPPDTPASNVSKLLCFDLIGGAFTKAFVGQEVKSRPFGRETLFYSFRKRILYFHEINSSSIEHHIVITDQQCNKTDNIKNVSSQPLSGLEHHFLVMLQCK